MTSEREQEALQRIFDAMLDAEIAAIEAPHIVVTTCLETGIVTYTGPYADAITALDAAEDGGWWRGDETLRSTVAQLIPPA